MSLKLRTLETWLLVALSLTTGTPAFAATFVVDSTADESDAAPGDGTCESTAQGECTLRAAIEEANALAGPDRIELPEGIFPGGHWITDRLHLEGRGPELTVIDGSNAGPVLLSGGQGSLSLFDLTVTNGNGNPDSVGITAAGGIGAIGNALSLTNVHVTHCTGWTGGIEAWVSNLALNDVVISHCTSTDLYGGGMTTGAFSGSIVRCRFSDNVGSGLHAQQAGSQAPLTIRDCVFERNHDALGHGGGISSVASRLRIESSTMSANEAWIGGGLHVTWLGTAQGRVDIINCTLSGNSAGGAGGGLFADAPGSARNTTIVGNWSARGGGALAEASFSLHGVILAGNDADEGPQCVGELAGRGNLVTDTASCAVDLATTLSGVDPLLGSLADNGGPTLTHALSPRSPALDAALPGDCIDASGLPLFEDQRGMPRPSGSACDLGAFELDVTLDTDGDGNPDVADNCIDVANESQSDADDDGRGDECDCAPDDAGAFDAPHGVTLSVTRASGVELAWTDLSARVGPGVLHDIASDTLASLRERGVADAPCLENGWMNTSWIDADAPSAGDVYYLVRAVNACGPAPAEGWGLDSFEEERPTCP